MVQTVKNLPAILETQGSIPWVIPWRREWQPTLVFLPEESHERTWQIMVHGVTESDTGEQLTLLLASFGASTVAQR